MILAARLLHSSNMTYLPTNLPVQYYGLPDEKVYIIYARFYDIGFDKSGVEYVFAIHQEFTYSYKEEKIVPVKYHFRNLIQNNAIIDNQDPIFRIIKVYRNINSFSEAFDLINKKAIQILNKINHKRNYRLNNKTEQKTKSKTA